MFGCPFCILAWYLWLRQDDIKGKKVLELGSGTALPGLLCAKFGAEKVYLTDDAWQENTLKNIQEAVKINQFSETEKVSVEGKVFIALLFFEICTGYFISVTLF